jgi:hypothetical protein
MKKIYLYSFIREVVVKNHGKRKEKFLVIFCPYKGINTSYNDIYNQLRNYFQSNILPDKIIVLCAEYNKNEITELFNKNSEIYDYIPLFTLDSEFENISIASLQKGGDFIVQVGFTISAEFIKEVINAGLVKIFNENGGLIVSQSAHHFVFPSGKHCDRFLRTGNVLIKGIHIVFIVFALYKHLKGKQFISIYCDTSSVNSLAFAYIDLLREFDSSFKSSVQVESFGSYSGFESGKFSAPIDSLFIISSSTSGSIIKRMIEDRKQNIQLENICIVYGLNVERTHSQRVICDLTKIEETNPEGLPPFNSYNVNKGETCLLCLKDSKPIDVKGDVFLLEKPNINGRLLTIKDNPSELRKFSDYFIKGPSNESILKCFYKEKAIGEKKYDLYVDVDAILKEWEHRNETHPFENIFSKLEKHILQNIPASIKYLIVLPDSSSSALAKIIILVLKLHGVMFDEKNILMMEDINTIDKKDSGCIAIVSACVTTGRNLLFISRALREYEDNYRRVYFTFINRTANKKHFEFLESNLSLGEFGKNTHKIINVETILCSQEAYLTPWHKEKEFLKELEEFCEEKSIKTVSFCKERIDILNNCATTNGLVDNLFFSSLSDKKLKINKGFAFAPAIPDFIQNSTQADIYFIMSTILHDCRCSGQLDQSEYVRNLIEPGNFVRFNDGIIQAAILRAAKPDELRYDLSPEMSVQIQNIMEDMINHIEDDHAEGILEFFYSLAIEKLRLTTDCLKYCMNLVVAKGIVKEDSLLYGITEYINQRIINQL